jgi:N-acetylglucosaminyldiphosphoundecaprenol N-acetyl-beta-D-mannosaminyltransferase
VESIQVLGCRLDPIGADEAVERIMDFARGESGAQVVTLGTEMVVYAQRDEAFRAVVNASALSLCDTVGVLAVARRRGAGLRTRVTGVDLMERLCARAAREGIAVYLLGGAPGVAEDAAAILEARFPGLRIAGAHDGFFTQDQAQGIVTQIRESRARIVFVGLGSPRQEMWLGQYLGATGCGVGIGVGGSFDVMSGRVRRAPRLWRRLGLEWLYRLIREPSRWRRQVALPRFVWLLLCEQVGIAVNPKARSL